MELSLYEPDDNAKHLQGIIIQVEESYGHCPRALNFSRLWDLEEIAANQAQRPVLQPRRRQLVRAGTACRGPSGATGPSTPRL